MFVLLCVSESVNKCVIVRQRVKLTPPPEPPRKLPKVLEPSAPLPTLNGALKPKNLALRAGLTA